MNLAYQSFQGLERRLPSEDVSESRLLQQIGRQEQRFQELEDRVAGLHNQQMEVGDRLGDLETGRCRCRDLVDDGPPMSPRSHPTSPSLSAVRGDGDEGEGTLSTVVENEVPIPIVVRGQRARRTVRFRLNSQPSPGRDGGDRTSREPTAFGSSQHRGGGRSSRRRRRGRGGRGRGLEYAWSVTEGGEEAAGVCQYG